MPTTVPDVNGMTTAEAAIAYAEAGFAIFPIRPGSKEPATRNGFHDATTDVDEIRETWSEANYGIGLYANGSDVVVIDVDDPDALDEETAALLDENATATSITAKGFHALYATDEDHGNGHRLGAGVDVRGAGYIVAPPSTHPSGHIYVWESNEIAPLPEAIQGRLGNASESVSPASVAEVRDFLQAHTSGTLTDRLEARIADYTKEAESTPRNEVLIRVLPEIFRDAVAGLYPAEDGLVALRDALGEYEEERWEDLVRRSVGYAKADDPQRLWESRAPFRMSARYADLVALPETTESDGDLYSHASMADAHLGERVARYFLRGEFVAWGRSAWSRWTGKVWDDVTDATVTEAVRKALLAIHAEETRKANLRLQSEIDGLRDRDLTDEEIRAANDAANRTHTARMKELRPLLTLGKIKSVQQIARGLVEVKRDRFDQEHDLLNVANGVVDLRTGELRPHDPDLLFSKITDVRYDPEATHEDWTKALTAMTPEVADWMQVRFGQAATGHTPEDDVVPFLYGGGANGKSTVLAGVNGALGEFATMVPEKVLLASPSDHPTENMTLHGARLAFIEELPEGDYLNPQRLKKAVGTKPMIARYIGQDNVSWMPTHSLMVTTNYEVHVDSPDTGTWRRLALVTFPYTFDGSDPERPKDPALRTRIERDAEIHEAVLAWLVAGAQRWYENGMVLPDPPGLVREETLGWKYRSNHAARFIEENLEPDPDGAVVAEEVYRLFKIWSESNGYRPPSVAKFWNRAKSHEAFRDGTFEKQDGSVRTSTWNVDHDGRRREPDVGARARLVTGARFSDEARDALGWKPHGYRDRYGDDRRGLHWSDE